MKTTCKKKVKGKKCDANQNVVIYNQKAAKKVYQQNSIYMYKSFQHYYILYGNEILFESNLKDSRL